MPDPTTKEHATMPLGVPQHVDDATLGRALTRAQQVSALTILVLVLLVLLVMQADRPGHGFWAAALAVLPVIVMQVARLASPSDLLSAAFLVFGGVAILTLDLSKSVFATGELTEAGVSLLAVRVALILCGSASASVAAGITWTALGYLTSEGAVIAASLTLGVPYQFSVGMLLAAVIVATLRPLARLATARVSTVLQQLHQAAIDDEAARSREALEQRAAALVHDTVLAQLHAIATADVGGLPDGLRAALTRSVTIVADDSRSSAQKQGDAESTEWQHSPLFAALQDARLMGLTVDVTGDPTLLSRLRPDASLAVGLAAAQCLTNVLKHSGTTLAEVAVYGTDTEECVMVIDSGKGFDEAATAADRIGLRSSVRRRIESVGGRVHVWSTPGQGTSIMLRVPDQHHDQVAPRDGEGTDA